MKKTLAFLGLFLLSLFIISPFEIYSIEKKEKDYDFETMTTYEMFWPLTAGKIPGDKFYNIKIWRDKSMGILILSHLKKSEYWKNLANKRLVEAEKLVELRRFTYLQSTLESSRKDMEMGLELLSKATQDWDYNWLTEEFRKDSTKHLIVLERMKEKAEKEEKEIFEKAIRDIKNLINRLNQS